MLQSLLASRPTIVVGKTGSSLLEENSYGGYVGLVACLAIGEQQVRKFIFKLFDVN